MGLVRTTGGLLTQVSVSSVKATIDFHLGFVDPLDVLDPHAPFRAVEVLPLLLVFIFEKTLPAGFNSLLRFLYKSRL